jgi:hypothetical protein
MDPITVQEQLKRAMARIGDKDLVSPDEGITMFRELRAELILAGATRADIELWLRQCVAPRIVRLTDTPAQREAVLKALCEGFEFQLPVDFIESGVTSEDSRRAAAPSRPSS